MMVNHKEAQALVIYCFNLIPQYMRMFALRILNYLLSHVIIIKGREEYLEMSLVDILGNI